MVAEPVIVVAGVIERAGCYLVSRRLKGTHLADLWEFPGGKWEGDETHEACLARELVEELGVASTIGRELIVTEHAYPDRVVRLHFHECEIAGEPQPMLGQELRWVTPAELRNLDVPAADRDVVDLLIRKTRP
jgi:mutator protein MutT